MTELEITGTQLMQHFQLASDGGLFGNAFAAVINPDRLKIPHNTAVNGWTISGPEMSPIRRSVPRASVIARTPRAVCPSGEQPAYLLSNW